MVVLNMPLVTGESVEEGPLYKRAFDAAYEYVRGLDPCPLRQKTVSFRNQHAGVASGRLIAFEGCEGAGKSTQLGLLADRLKRAGVETVTTREPGGSPHAERLRDFLLSGRGASLGPLGEAVLFTAARIDHIDSLIAPALEKGVFVLCDRLHRFDARVSGRDGQGRSSA